MHLTMPSGTLDLSARCAVMAIVNRTPDSFYDRGANFALAKAVDHAMAQVAAGADIIDVGGVKAGPGDEVTPEAELDRIVPFVEAIRARSDIPVSVDTFRATVASAALEAGADLVNDVSGLSEVAVADVVAAHPSAALVVMHAGGAVRTRPFRPDRHPDATTEIVATCAALAAEAERRGVPRDRIVVDPGHDFGKTTAQSLECTRRLGELAALDYPVLVALSRKDFLGEVLGYQVAPADRLEASLAAAAVSIMLGARIVRVHDTEPTVRAVRTVEAILGWRDPAIQLRGLS